jgi:hypothetical protein
MVVRKGMKIPWHVSKIPWNPMKSPWNATKMSYLWRYFPWNNVVIKQQDPPSPIVKQHVNGRWLLS